MVLQSTQFFVLLPTPSNLRTCRISRTNHTDPSEYIPTSNIAIDTSQCHGLPAYLIFTFLFRLSYLVLSVTPGRFAHRLLNYLWTALAFSRDFHTILYASSPSLRFLSIVFPYLPVASLVCVYKLYLVA